MITILSLLVAAYIFLRAFDLMTSQDRHPAVQFMAGFVMVGAVLSFVLLWSAARQLDAALRALGSP
jgi:hypothetical protein